MKIRSDSLAAKLGPVRREKLLEWLLLEAVSYDEAVRRLAEDGIDTSAAAIWGFLQKHGLAWRLEKARESMEDEDGDAMPAEWEKEIKRRLKKRLFAASFEELSLKEVLSGLYYDLDERKVELEQSKGQRDQKKIEMQERRIEALEQQVELARAAADKAKTAARRDISDADREQILNEVDRMMGIRKGKS